MSTDYLDYNGYALYRDQIPNFGDYKGSDEDIVHFLTTVRIEENIKQSISSYCRIIKKYIGSVKEINLNDNYICGNCIKYYIKSKIEEDHNENAKSIFIYLNKYINTLNSDLFAKECTFEFELDDDNKYEKIKNLYNIYNIYWLINNGIRNRYPNELICPNIKTLIEKYNTLIRMINDSGNIDIRNKLYHIRCIFESNNSLSHISCSRNFEDRDGVNEFKAYKTFCKTERPSNKELAQMTHSEGGNLQMTDSRGGNLQMTDSGGGNLQTRDLERDTLKIFARKNTNKNIIITTVIVMIYRESLKKLRLIEQRKMRKAMNMDDKQCEHMTCKYKRDDGHPDKIMYDITYTSAR
ncbi:variable surface protein [Plasmodium gonderi]|uniref:Variable surface protein n=1 Tax=Plasmodium gonderi TaxID=77519 RepID=A0A1Y1JU33_PLAGO|nr:variable surface protein [Plasmodium gonderi]GAW83913.1 variable surface protein [Plasmodium gonderi]